MIKAVLFDVGGTLITPHPSVGVIYSELARRHGISAPAATLQERFKSAWKKKKVLRQQQDKSWWKDIVTDVFAPYSFKNFDEFFDDLYSTFTDKNRWKIHADALATLKALKEQGVLLAVASNWDNRLPKLLRDLNLAPYFDYQFISSLIGFSKPDPEFFKFALRMVGLEPEEVLHVGDDPEEDGVGAVSVGIKFFLKDQKVFPKNFLDQIS